MTISPRRPVFDANATGGAFGDLPEWNLSDLYTAPDAPELAQDMEWLEKACAAFAADYEGKLADLDAAGMAECIARYEAIEEKAGRVMSYTGLRYYQNTVDAGRVKLLSDAQDKITTYTTPLVFFSLEFNRIPDDRYEAVFADPKVSRYKPVFDRMRAMKPYQLSDELEKFLHDQSVVGAAAWNRLFDETTAALE
ncbi:MAG: oligoendopeptidase F, partial [Thioclava sp.]|nr:oligoendopeptidase F [Thioclava sp.]